MDKILIDKKILERIKLRLQMQYDLFAKPEYVQKIPLHQKPILAIERKMIKTELESIDEALKDER